MKIIVPLVMLALPFAGMQTTSAQTEEVQAADKFGSVAFRLRTTRFTTDEQFKVLGAPGARSG